MRQSASANQTLQALPCSIFSTLPNTTFLPLNVRYLRVSDAGSLDEMRPGKGKNCRWIDHQDDHFVALDSIVETDRVGIDRSVYL